MTSRRARFLILNTIGTTALGATWYVGAIAGALGGVTPYVMGFIVAAVLWGLAHAWRGRWDDVAWLAEKVVMLGIAGTVIGFIATFAALGLNAADTAGTIAAVSTGMSISLHATLAGVVGSLWLELNRWLLK